MHLRFLVEEGIPVTYVYEIQVAPEFQVRRGGRQVGSRKDALCSESRRGARGPYYRGDASWVLELGAVLVFYFPALSRAVSMPSAPRPEACSGQCSIHFESRRTGPRHRRAPHGGRGSHQLRTWALGDHVDRIQPQRWRAAVLQEHWILGGPKLTRVGAQRVGGRVRGRSRHQERWRKASTAPESNEQMQRAGEVGAEREPRKVGLARSEASRKGGTGKIRLDVAAACGQSPWQEPCWLFFLA